MRNKKSSAAIGNDLRIQSIFPPLLQKIFVCNGRSETSKVFFCISIFGRERKPIGQKIDLLRVFGITWYGSEREVIVIL